MRAKGYRGLAAEHSARPYHLFVYELWKTCGELRDGRRDMVGPRQTNAEDVLLGVLIIPNARVHPFRDDLFTRPPVPLPSSLACRATQVRIDDGLGNADSNRLRIVRAEVGRTSLLRGTPHTVMCLHNEATAGRVRSGATRRGEAERGMRGEDTRRGLRQRAAASQQSLTLHGPRVVAWGRLAQGLRSPH